MSSTRWLWQPVSPTPGGAKDPSWHGRSLLQSLADCLRSGAHSAHSAGAGRPPEEVMGGLGCILTLAEFLEDDV